MSGLSLKLDSVSSKPLYQQLAVQLKKGIKQGKFEPHLPLPSIVELSRSLSISKATPMRAYTHLAKEGLVKWEKGKGFFIKLSMLQMR